MELAHNFDLFTMLTYVLICFFFSHFYYRDECKIASTPIPEEFYQIGMICAAMYNLQWHRAKIVDVFDKAVKVTVSFWISYFSSFAY